jgi:hypothetical protein
VSSRGRGAQHDEPEPCRPGAREDSLLPDLPLSPILYLTTRRRRNREPCFFENSTQGPCLTKVMPMTKPGFGG